MFVSDSGYMSHMVNSLKNMTNLQEVKIVVKKGNKKTIIGSLQVKWKGYQERAGRLYLVMYMGTSYIPGLSVNISSVVLTMKNYLKRCH